MTQWYVLRALARYGEVAAPTAPLLRKLASAAVSPGNRLAAAHALWAATGDTGTALSALRAGVESEDAATRDLTLQLLGSLGPAAAPLGDIVRAADGGARAAITLWKVTVDTDEALPRLLHHWSTDPKFRPAIAACLTEMGTTASPALPLVQAELASPRRHHNDGLATRPRQDITADEELLRDCRRIQATLASSAAP
ncbi:hypothetical protein GCM10017771_90580 [Streptomyces capitiformicae]|uniref:HEAT repeat domain-containing protein n=1 Tax=Streptomyces capitiformicae TaxID=2014920 RepID=A0A918ZRL9_9ACTN|nr:hypothetical protein [Streptomyces capitiformicae]GHE66814.1 hypothetical protein GCM10017771_90580 [Streptomyces capitiformicae]